MSMKYILHAYTLRPTRINKIAYSFRKIYGMGAEEWGHQVDDLIYVRGAAARLFSWKNEKITVEIYKRNWPLARKKSKNIFMNVITLYARRNRRGRDTVKLQLSYSMNRLPGTYIKIQFLICFAYALQFSA